MVLGIDRLKTLSEVIHNWKEQSMHFKRERWVELKTSSSTMYPPISLKVWLAKQTGGLWGQMGAVTEGSLMPAWNNSLNPTKQQQSCAMLETYAEIFTGPQGLPPTRLYDHSINLLPNQGPVSVRPYRYPYVQKEEIKRRIQEMLERKIIRHIGSAYSSPIILVRKKDQSWRMCIDYKALNKVTVPDKFPIPIIEELIVPPDSQSWRT